MPRLAPLLVLLLWEITELDAVTSDLCYLTPQFGNIGTRKFFEECEEIGEIFFLCFIIENISIFLGKFTKVPKPLTDSTSAFGVHSVICCPDHQPDPADAEAEENNYEEEYDSDYDYSSYDFIPPSKPPLVCS